MCKHIPRQKSPSQSGWLWWVVCGRLSASGPRDRKPRISWASPLHPRRSLCLR